MNPLMLASKDRSKESTPFGFRRLSRPLLGSVNIACNTVTSIAGANSPLWILCRVFGILVSVSLRPLFVTTRIDEWMTPRPFIHSCLALMVALLCWLLVRK
jgi:hypothetical protein